MIKCKLLPVYRVSVLKFEGFSNVLQILRDDDSRNDYDYMLDHPGKLNTACSRCLMYCKYPWHIFKS